MNSISSEGSVGPSADGTSTPRRCKTMDRFTQAGKKKKPTFPELEETPGKISGHPWEWKDKPPLLWGVRGQWGTVGGTERLIQTVLESKPRRSRSMCPLDFRVTEGKRADGSVQMKMKYDIFDMWKSNQMKENISWKVCDCPTEFGHWGAAGQRSRDES